MKTYLFGNGLSLAYSKEYFQLTNLSDLLEDRLGSIKTQKGRALGDEVRDIAKAFGQKNASDFEFLAGPIDTLSRVLLQLLPIQSVASDGQTKVALAKLSIRLQRIYRQVVGIVLELVTNRIREDWSPINKVAGHLYDQAKRDGELEVFTLNYDSLLDSALLQLSGQHPAVTLMDEFDGRQTYDLSATIANQSRKIRVLAWREGQYLAPNPLRLHHLHGAATWIEFERVTHKAMDLDALRVAGLFEAWAKGEDVGLAPLVVLTDQKDRLVGRAPFAEAYEQLGAALRRSSEVVIAGYAFRDEPLNRVLAASVAPGSTAFVITPTGRVQKVAQMVLEKAGAKTKILDGKLPDMLDVL